MITFIVSTFQRPETLEGCLATIRIQPAPKRVIVADNSLDASVDNNRLACAWFGAEHVHTAMGDAYSAANKVVETERIESPWLCFPSDDGLMVAGFSQIMLDAAKGNGLVYCDCIYRQDPLVGSWPAYRLLDAAPMMGRIDKTNFIVRRELFKGFPPHPKGWCDGALIEQLIAQGVKHAKAPGILVLHQ